MKLFFRFFASVFSLLFFCFSLVAMPVPAAWAEGASFMEQVQDIMESVDVHKGTFSVQTKPIDVTTRIIVEKATVSFDPETMKEGTVDVLKIAQTNGKVLYNCVNLKVKKGTDLIRSCGGPANLTPGNTVIYSASGSGFGPETDGRFSVKLEATIDPS